MHCYVIVTFKSITPIHHYNTLTLNNTHSAHHNDNNNYHPSSSSYSLVSPPFILSLAGLHIHIFFPHLASFVFCALANRQWGLSLFPAYCLLNVSTCRKWVIRDRFVSSWTRYVNHCTWWYHTYLFALRTDHVVVAAAASQGQVCIMTMIRGGLFCCLKQ